MMLTEICQELRNWFDRDLDKYYGDFSIQDGRITTSGLNLKEGQYFRIIGSVFNDGVHFFPYDESLVDEDFSGSVWAMAVPPTVIALSEKIGEWQEKYTGMDGVLMSPYQSESFGGYSYSKSSGSSGGSGGGGSPFVTWQSMFASELNRWRKI